MAVVWPSKNNFANGDVLTAANMNNIGDTLNVFNPTSATNGQVLTANGSGGVSYQAVSADGWTLITSGALSGSSTISMTSIPQTYKNLHLMVVNWGSATGTRLYALYNNAQTNNFWTSIRWDTANGSVAGAFEVQTLTGFPQITYPTSTNGSTNNFCYLMIPEYTRTTERTSTFVYDVAQGTLGAGSPRVAGRGILATSGYTTAITRLDLYSSTAFNAGNYYLYGEK